MSFPRYPAYKDSGVEWLGEIPADWSVLPAKYGIASKSGGQTTKNTVSAEPGDGLFPAFSASGQDIWMEEFEFEGPALVLSAVGARCGKTFKADGRWGVVANTHCLFPRREFNRDFLWYLTNREDWWERGGTAQPFVKVSETLARKWVFPTPCEQAVIAQFLDHETAKIDALVAEQERLIGLLKEKRQAVISHAVTKGLDPSVPMKDSGVEWLGEVPAHWDRVHLGRVCLQVSDGPHFSPSYVDEGVMFLSARNIGVDGWYLDDAKFVSESDYLEFCKRVTPAKGDVLYTKGGTTGIARVVDFEDRFQVWVHVAVLKIDREIANPNFVAYALNSVGCYEQSQLHTRGATNQDLGLTRMTKIWLALPSLNEQLQVVSMLDEAVVKFDVLVDQAKQAIELLKERRTALISSAVTGQIDVRGWMPAEMAA